MRDIDPIAHFAGRLPARRHPPILVVLADDHQTMRRNLRALLDGERDIEVVAEAGDLTTAAREVRTRVPHVLVIDLRLRIESAIAHSGSGLELTTLVRSQTPCTQVVVVTMQENEAFVSKAVSAGAVGFVRKELAETELVDAVRAAARGERFTSSRLTRH